jgi:DNA-binding FadR family transcriptional regulator
MAAVRATPADLHQISAALDDMAAGRSPEETIEADLRFHLSVAQAAHNRYFEMVLGPLTEVYLQQIKLTDSYIVGVDLHRKVFECVAKGDPVAARQAVRRMMRATREHTRKAVRLLSSAGS